MYGLMLRDIGLIQISFIIAVYFKMSLEKIQKSLLIQDFNFRELCGHAIKTHKQYII